MASVFTSMVTERISVPGHPDEHVVIRKLAPKHLKEARQASQVESMEGLKAMGGPAFLKEVAEMGGEKAVKDAAAKAVTVDPLMQYDRVELMRGGIVSWSFSKAVSHEAIDDLEDDLQDAFARDILKLAKPSLFTEPTEDDTKNASGLLTPA